MSDATSQAVVAKAMDKELPGLLTVRRYTDSQRVQRAIIAGVLWLLVTALTILIPIAHFILPPLGLLCTPVVIFLAYRHKGSIVGSDLHCPACGAEIKPLKIAEKYPIFENCPKCSREVSIRPQTMT